MSKNKPTESRQQVQERKVEEALDRYFSGPYRDERLVNMQTHYGYRVADAVRGDITEDGLVKDPGGMAPAPIEVVWVRAPWVKDPMALPPVDMELTNG